MWSGNDALHKKLEADKSAVGRQRLHYFLINDGPWSRLDENEPFIEGVPSVKPPQANFYPDDITKDEFNSWLAGLPGSEKEKATGYFYTIRRDAGGKLMSVPYNEEYREFLEPAAKLLRESRGANYESNAERLPEQARRCFWLKRLLCERCCLDGP